MPRGVAGYRWVETGYGVWQLEDTPRHYRGCVSVTSDSECYAWWVTGQGPSGESATRDEAKREVERHVIPARSERWKDRRAGRVRIGSTVPR